MLFNSYAFIFIYLPVVLTGFFVLARWRTSAALTWLALASLYFYGYWNVRYVGLLLASITINYGLSHGLVRLRAQPRRAKALLLGALTFNLALLAYFKYANFFASNVAQALGQSWSLTDIVLPMGISFFTFTQIAFLVDTYRRKVDRVDFIPYVLFVTYFPHLIAGPILHHSQMMPQFANSQLFKFDKENFGLGLTIFILGLAKKVLLADVLAEAVDPAFGAAVRNESPPTALAWIGALSYSLQLYFDFSGYSDMAIGLALMMNIRLPLNFDSPYKAKSIIEFWRHWHMTLSQFLRDYLYIALGGNRHGSTRRYVYLFITMLLGGLWHGASWNFVVWGALHGLYLMVNHGWRSLTRSKGDDADITKANRAMTYALSFFYVSLTYFCVLVAWVFFRADDMPAALHVLHSMFGNISAPNLRWVQIREPIKYILLGSIIVWCAPNSQQLLTRFRPGYATGALAAILFIACIDRLNLVSEFLYFRF
jgi:alginate O-acetyltransferase complex protein AlgI